MRILFLGNNQLAVRVLQWLTEQKEEIAGLVIHPPERSRFADELLATAPLPASRVFDGSHLDNEDVLESIRDLKPDIGLSVMFGYIVKRRFLDVLPGGCLNVHTSLLPYNRGAYPNVWSIVEGTPAGVSLHYMDEGVDTGDIVSQGQVQVEPVDTGEMLYHKLEEAALQLFKRTWPAIRAGNMARHPQDPRGGTSHRVSDVETIDEIRLDETVTARKLIDLIRARTHSRFPGAYFMDGNRKVYLRLQLYYDDRTEG